jgi:hypothetical protein
VLKIKKSGDEYESIYENSCGDDAISIDGMNNPVITQSETNETMKSKNFFSFSR